MFKAISKFFGSLLGKIGVTPGGILANALGYLLGLVVSDIITPAMRPFRYANERINRNKLLTEGEYLDLYFRGKISLNKLYDLMSNLGYSNENIHNMIETKKPLLNPADICNLLHRKEITLNTAKYRLKQYGFSDKEADEVITLSSYIPTVPDMIRFAVRDVLSPEVVERYGLLQDYPKDLDRLVELGGLDVKYAKYYWGAHWELPSLTQAFDMYHRGIITDSDIDLLLKTADVLPYWRPKMKKLAETPFTRVDLGRMFDLKVLSFEELVKGYKDLGYSTEKATKMSEFVRANKGQEVKDLSKTELIKAFDLDLITEQELKDDLAGIGYDPEEVELLLAIENSKKIMKFTSTYISALKREFLNERIDRQDSEIYLNKLALHSEAIEQLLDSWELEKVPKVKLPSKTEVLKWFKAGNIDEGTAKDYLSKMGYEDKVINLYLIGSEE